MPDENDIPIPIQEAIAMSYLGALSGDTWSRVDNTGSLLTLLTGVVEQTKNHDEKNILFKAITTWQGAVEESSIALTQKDAIIHSSQAIRAVSKMVYKYGRFTANQFAQLQGLRDQK